MTLYIIIWLVVGFCQDVIEPNKWQYHSIPEARCLDGSTWGFITHFLANEDGTPFLDKIAIDFQPGGVCRDGTTCNPDSFFWKYYWKDYILLGVDPQIQQDVELHSEECDLSPYAAKSSLQNRCPEAASWNPFLDYSYIYVLTCTADFNLGAASVDYGDGYVANQHGGLWIQEYIYKQFLQTQLQANPSEFFLTGVSSATLGLLMWSLVTANRYPEADVNVFMLSALMVTFHPGDFEKAAGLISTFKMDNVEYIHEASKAMGSSTYGIIRNWFSRDYSNYAANVDFFGGRVRFAQFQNLKDPVRYKFQQYILLVSGDFIPYAYEWTATQMRESENIAIMFGGGSQHGVFYLNGGPEHGMEFKDVRVSQVNLWEWIRDFLHGDIYSVSCTSDDFDHCRPQDHGLVVDDKGILSLATTESVTPSLGTAPLVFILLLLGFLSILFIYWYFFARKNRSICAWNKFHFDIQDEI